MAGEKLFAEVDVSPLDLNSDPPGEAVYTRTPETDILMDRSRSYWQVGEWEKLAELGEMDLQAHPDRAKLSLLAAVGHFQLGEMDRGRFHARKAQDWGCDRHLLAQVLIGGVYNSLGRVASLIEDEQRAETFFETSIRVVSPRSESSVTGRTRNIHEKARLGLLPEAAKLLDLQLDRLAPRIAPPDLEATRRQIEDLALRLETPRAAEPAPRLALPEILRITAASKNRRPARPIFVCTHHKAGTNFVLPVFRRIAKAFDMPLWLKFYDPEPERWEICLHQHGRVLDLLPRHSFSGLHVVRHPMSLIYSATLYHEICTEPWVDVPMDRFDQAAFLAFSTRKGYEVIKDPDRSLEEKGAMIESGPDCDVPVARFDSGYAFEGRTYREMLASFETLEEKIRFEMNAYSRGVIRDMTSFPTDHRIHVVKLEDISRDTQMTALREAFRRLGFGGAQAARCLDIASQHCLWNIPRPEHATTGMSNDWRAVFQGDLEADFRRLFGWAEQALGYD